MRELSKDENNSRAFRLIRRRLTRCDRCKPHDGSNRRRRPRPDDYKDHRN